MTPAPKMHPFERSGLGVGPFKFLFVASIPSPSLAEHNPEAYNAALRALPKDVPCGICAHCGMAIMHNYIIRSADGRKSAVGCDCVMKIGDPVLGNAVEIAARRLRREADREKRQAARERQHAAWLAQVDANGETNAQRQEREAAQRQAAKDAQLRAERAKAAKWNFVLPVLRLKAATSPFVKQMIEEIEGGRAPEGRAANIIRDIYAKAAGRSGSKAYEAALDEFDSRMGEED